MTQRSKADPILQPYGANGTELSTGGFMSKRETLNGVRQSGFHSARESQYTSVSKDNLALEVQMNSELNGPNNFVECSQSNEKQSSEQESSRVSDILLRRSENQELHSPMVIEESQGYMSPLDFQLIKERQVPPLAESNNDKIVVPLINQNTHFIQSFLSQSSTSNAKTSGWNIDFDQNNIPSQIHKSTNSNLNSSPVQFQMKSSFSQQQIHEYIEHMNKEKNCFVKLKVDENSSKSIVIESNSIKNLYQLHNIMTLGSFAAQESNKNQSFDNLAILNNQQMAMMSSFANNVTATHDAVEFKEIERHSFDFEDKESADKINIQQKQTSEEPETFIAKSALLTKSEDPIKLSFKPPFVANFPDFNYLKTLTEGTNEDEKTNDDQLKFIQGEESRNIMLRLINTNTYKSNEEDDSKLDYSGTMQTANFKKTNS
jgi:hypothetical protein